MRQNTGEIDIETAKHRMYDVRMDIIYTKQPATFIQTNQKSVPQNVNTLVNGYEIFFKQSQHEHARSIVSYFLFDKQKKKQNKKLLLLWLVFRPNSK